MRFQRKIWRLLTMQPSPFGRGDRCLIRVLLYGPMSATDLASRLQWFHVMGSLLATYATLRTLSALDPREMPARFQAAIARGIKRWYVAQAPLRVDARQREECMDRLIEALVEELRRTEFGGGGDGIEDDMQTIVRVLEGQE